MKKMVLLSGLAFASMCYGAYYDSQTLITFNEPITVRVLDFYTHGAAISIMDNSCINFCYDNDWIATNVVNSKVLYSYTVVSNDYQISLNPISYNGMFIYTSYELGPIPDSFWVCGIGTAYTTLNIGKLNCQRLIGYLVNDRWLDKNGNDITGKFNLMTDLNELRNRQRASRIHPDMQLNSVISMTENSPKISFDIVYSGEKVVWGKKELTDSEWVDVTDLDKSEYRFFKVSLKSN